MRKRKVCQLHVFIGQKHGGNEKLLALDRLKSYNTFRLISGMFVLL